MRTALCIIAVCGVCGWIIGVLLDRFIEWHEGQINTDERHPCESCDNCMYSDREWDEDPCCQCGDDDSMWRERTDAIRTI